MKRRLKRTRSSKTFSLPSTVTSFTFIKGHISSSVEEVRALLYELLSELTHQLGILCSSLYGGTLRPGLLASLMA